MRLFLVARKAAELTLLPARLLAEYTSSCPTGAHISQRLCPHPTIPACLGASLSSVGATEEGWAMMKKGLE